MKINSRDIARVLVGVALTGIVVGLLYGASKDLSLQRLQENVRTFSREVMPTPPDPEDDNWRIVG